jgi:hypothetical protein
MGNLCNIVKMLTSAQAPVKRTFGQNMPQVMGVEKPNPMQTPVMASACESLVAGAVAMVGTYHQI